MYKVISNSRGGGAMRIFLICPVNRVTKKELAKIRRYVKKLEKEGHEVYWPYRDTNQNDPVGLRICRSNLRAMKRANKVYVWYSRTSRGSVFDTAMARALGKPIRAANTKPGFLRRFVNKTAPDNLLKKVLPAEKTGIRWAHNSARSIATLGTAFALGKKIKLLNPESVKPTPRKSFENVLLALSC